VGIFDELMRDAADPDSIEDLRNQIVVWIQPGFTERAEVVRFATEYLEDDELPLTDGPIDWQRRLP
jgi:hypothetical protein